MEITAELLDEIEAKAKAATDGPWRFEAQDSGGCCLVEPDRGSMGATYPSTLTGKPLNAVANAVHITRLDPPTTLALVARIRELEGEVNSLEDAMREAISQR